MARRLIRAVAAATLLTALGGTPALAQEATTVPTVTVTPSTDLAPDGSTEITISGTGFDPAGNGGRGYGLRGGPELPTLTDPGTAHGFQLARLIIKGAKGAQIPLTDAGAWTYKTKLKAVYTGSDGVEHNAARTPFNVYTFAWRGTETTWDTATPVKFTATYQPQLGLSASSVVQGGKLVATGTGFAPQENVVLDIGGATARTDATGGFSSEVTIPADLAVGEHELVATGATSAIPAKAAFTVTASTTAPCVIKDEVTRGTLLWGFKKSFRTYVGTSLVGGSAKGNSIVAADGAEITNIDEVVSGGKPNPDGIPTGAYRYGFSSARYTSPTDLTGQYAGSVRFSYPAHFFALTVANPKVVLSGDTGTLYADVKLESSPGSPSKPVDLKGVALAALDSSAAVRTVENGLATVSGVKVTLTNAEAFAGFYQPGTVLDDLTVTLGASCATVPVGGPTAVIPVVDQENLVPPLRYRPLANTGATTGPIYLGGSLLLGGVVLLWLARRRATVEEGVVTTGGS